MRLLRKETPWRRSGLRKKTFEQAVLSGWVLPGQENVREKKQKKKVLCQPSPNQFDKNQTDQVSHFQGEKVQLHNNKRDRKTQKKTVQSCQLVQGGQIGRELCTNYTGITTSFLSCQNKRKEKQCNKRENTVFKVIFERGSVWFTVDSLILSRRTRKCCETKRHIAFTQQNKTFFFRKQKCTVMCFRLPS